MIVFLSAGWYISSVKLAAFVSSGSPEALLCILRSGEGSVEVLRCPARWYGVTYAADKPQVVAALKEKTESGLYPDGLWG